MSTSLNKSFAYFMNRVKSERILSICILLFAVLWRLFAGFQTPITQLYGDMVHYDHIASAILSHHVYSYWGFDSDAQITPGYPMFLSLCYFIANMFFPNHPFELVMALAFQSVLSGISVFLVYKLCRQCTSLSLSLFAALAYFLYPPASWAASIILTETVYTFFLLLSLYTFFIAMQKNTKGSFATCGLVVGLCTTVRPTVLPLIAAPILYFVYSRYFRKKSVFVQAKKRLVHSTAYAAGFVLPLIPWWVRNVLTFHHAILTDTDAGNPLLFGTDPNFQSDANLGANLDASGQTKLALARITYFFSHEFWAYLWWYTGEKLFLLFSTPWYFLVVPGDYSGWSAFVLFRLHLHLPFVILGSIGLILGFFHPQMRYISWFTLFLVLLLLPFIPLSRYAFPTIPFFFIGAAYLMQWVLAHLLLTRRSSTTYA